MTTGTLNGTPCLSAVVHVPAWGLPFADVELDREATFTGAVELVLADATFKCAVVSGGPWLGRSSYRLVGGAGGWGKPIPKRGYHSDGGIKRSTVIADAAAAAGETCEGIPTGSVGPNWERGEGAASQSLQLLTPRAWYVDADGVTRFGKRAAGTVSDSIARGKVDRAGGFVELMSDAIAAIVPGVVVEGIEAVDVVHELRASKLRTTIWGSAFAGTSKRLQLWAKLLEQVRPDLRYRGTFEYRVVTQEGERLNLQPVLASLGLPDVGRARVRAGIPGARAEHHLGSYVLVSFVNADPGRPVVVGFEDPEGEGYLPSVLELGPSPRLGIARQTDAVVAGPFAGTITGGSSTVKAGA